VQTVLRSVVHPDQLWVKKQIIVSLIDAVASPFTRSRMTGMLPMTSMIFKFPAVSLLRLMILPVVATPARAQHRDWMLGSNGLDSGSQALQGINYQNPWSYYHASGSDFAAIGPLKCGSY
jgi:hypothetical protein